MAVYSVTTNTQIDDGTDKAIDVTNTGTVNVTLSTGDLLKPGQAKTICPTGAVTASVSPVGGQTSYYGEVYVQTDSALDALLAPNVTHDASAYQPLPSGTPVAGQVPAVSTASPLAMSWATTATLSNNTPLAASGTGGAGTASDGSRSDHFHPDNSQSAPQLNGLLGWAFDPVNGLGTNVSSNVIVATRVLIPSKCTPGNLLAYVNVAGSSLTSGQNLGGLWKADGTLVATTADQTTAWQSTGLKTMSISATNGQSLTNLAAGIYFVGFLSNGTTRPQFFGTNPGVISNAGLSGSGLSARAAYSSTGATSLPTTLTLTGGTTQQIWAGVS